MSTSLKVLMELQDDTDLALDFVEHEIGANNFVSNWAKLKASKNAANVVSSWLSKIGAKGDADRIVQVIDELSKSGTGWLTPFTTTIP